MEICNPYKNTEPYPNSHAPFLGCWLMLRAGLSFLCTSTRSNELAGWRWGVAAPELSPSQGPHGHWEGLGGLSPAPCSCAWLPGARRSRSPGSWRRTFPAFSAWSFARGTSWTASCQVWPRARLWGCSCRSCTPSSPFWGCERVADRVRRGCRPSHEELSLRSLGHQRKTLQASRVPTSRLWLCPTAAPMRVALLSLCFSPHIHNVGVGTCLVMRINKYRLASQGDFPGGISPLPQSRRGRGRLPRTKGQMSSPL